MTNYPGDPRTSVKGKALAKQVLAEEPWCVYCGAPATQADHIVPLAAGGEHVRENMQGTCAPCNQSKGHRRAPKTRTIKPTKVLSEGPQQRAGGCLDGTHGHLVKDSGRAPKPNTNPSEASVIVTHGAWYA